MKVLLDTNVLIAAFATRGLCHDVLRTVLAEHRLVVGKTNLDELERILGDKLGMPNHRVREAVTFVSTHAQVVSPDAPASWPERDPDDRWVVAAARHGSVDVLVTGDQDLLNADSPAPFRIVTPREFWQLLLGHG